MQLSDYGQRIIEQYLAEVSASLPDVPAEEREAVCEDLRAHIQQALEESVEGEPNAADVHTVLATLGDPAEYAAEASPERVPSARTGQGGRARPSPSALVALTLTVLGVAGLVAVRGGGGSPGPASMLVWGFVGAFILAAYVLGREWGPTGNRVSRVLAAVAIGAPVFIALTVLFTSIPGLAGPLVSLCLASAVMLGSFFLGRAAASAGSRLRRVLAALSDSWKR